MNWRINFLGNVVSFFIIIAFIVINYSCSSNNDNSKKEENIESINNQLTVTDTSSLTTKLMKQPTDSIVNESGGSWSTPLKNDISDTNSKGPNIFIWGPLFSLLGLILGFFLAVYILPKSNFFKKKKRSNGKSNEKLIQNNNEQRELHIKNLEQRNGMFERKIREQEIKIDELEKELEVFKINGKNEVISSVEVKTENLKYQVFYIDVPYKGGSYANAALRTNKDENFSNYKLLIHSNNLERGDLCLLDDAKFHNILTNMEVYLDPFCEVENPLDRPKAQKIVTMQNGSMERRGDKWIIVKKVKVKLI